MTVVFNAGRLQGPKGLMSRKLSRNINLTRPQQNHFSLNKSLWEHYHGLPKYTSIASVRGKILNTSATSPKSQSNPATVKDAPVILWFKHDLRIDDHPGLHQAFTSSNTIIPFFCFDPKRYEQVVHSTSSAAALSRAVTSLRSSLRSLGSDLIISCGSWEEQISNLVSAVGAGAVITEEEIEKDWKDGLDAVAASTSNINKKNDKDTAKVAFNKWTAPLFDTYTPEKFTEWKKQRTPAAASPPLDPPASLPTVPSQLLDSLSSSSTNSTNSSSTSSTTTTGTTIISELPSPSEMLQQVRDSTIATTDDAFADLIGKHSTTATAGGEQVPAWAMSSSSSIDVEEESRNGNGRSTIARSKSSSPGSNGAKFADKVIEKLPGETSTSETIAEVENELASANGNGMGFNLGGSGGSGASSDWGAELAAELAAGEGPVMEALNAYLRHVETTGDGGGSTWQWKLGSEIGKFDVPAAPDGCFPALFNRAMSLGVVSRRRILAEAMELLEKQKNESYMPVPAGIFAKIGWLLTSSGGALVLQKRQRKATAAAAAAEAGDFHAGLARGRKEEVHGAKLRHWRWRGILTDYLVAHPETPLPGAPAVLLVHGFGAFSEHWRDNVASLASQGFTVYAPTLVGYGRSEKPAIPYGQDVWRDCVADFLVQVVRQPVVIAGNSIGGFIAASVAADYPKTVVGVVLVNSAGLLKEGYRPPETPPAAPSPPLFIVEGVSRALFAFLQGDVTNQLRRVYPVAPSRADSWLGQEIGRASADPGALGVFRSVFYLPKPRALNYLISDAFQGPVLVLQGAKDPLNDAVGRATEIDRLCSNAEVVLLDAGHCPHDEKPEEFNEKMAEFMKKKFVMDSKATGRTETAAGR